MTSIERVRRLYDESASGYDRKIRVPERLLFGDGRQWAAGLARGRTLEVAVGTGRNLSYYDPGVALTAVDVSERMLDLARDRAGRLGRAVDLAVAEMARVLRPGGRLVLLDHVRSPLTPVRAVQRALQPLFLRLEADHLLREPERRVQAAGLDVEQCTRSKLGLVLRLVARTAT